MLKTRLQALRRLEQVLTNSRVEIGEACQLVTDRAEADRSDAEFQELENECHAASDVLQRLWQRTDRLLVAEREKKERKHVT